MYQRILLAYDGSQEGLIALREGAVLAKRSGSKVYLLSVLPETSGVLMAESVGGDVVGPQVDTYRGLLTRGLDVLKQLGLTAEGRLVVGEPAPQIAAFAKQCSADLIVLGHKHHTALSRWFNDSTSAYVSDHVPCSVLMGCNSITDEAFQAELQGAAAPVQ
jgi:nucleotide-binding universal stress UspA family protein